MVYLIYFIGITIYIKNIQNKHKNFLINLKKKFRIGFTVASNPWTTILLSMLCVIACSCGLFKLRLEKDPLKIWTPEKTKFYRDTQWLTKNFENGYREQTILLTADNVLHPNVLKKIGIIRKSIINIGVKDQLGSRVQWKNICFK